MFSRNRTLYAFAAGTSVDANVLIFERIREELGNGSTPQAGIFVYGSRSDLKTLSIGGRKLANPNMPATT